MIGDVWKPEERGKAIAIYSLAPLLGPVIGPVCGGWIADRSTWRWVVRISQGDATVALLEADVALLVLVDKYRRRGHPDSRSLLPPRN